MNIVGEPTSEREHLCILEIRKLKDQIESSKDDPEYNKLFTDSEGFAARAYNIDIGGAPYTWLACSPAHRDETLLTRLELTLKMMQAPINIDQLGDIMECVIHFDVDPTWGDGCDPVIMQGAVFYPPKNLEDAYEKSQELPTEDEIPKDAGTLKNPWRFKVGNLPKDPENI